MSTLALLEADFVYRNFEHQLREFENHSDAPARAMAWTMRTGKSKTTIDRAMHLYAKRSKIDAVLIFAPNGVHANWIDVEFPKHAWPGVSVATLAWRSSELSLKAANKLSKADTEEFNVRRDAWIEKLKQAKHSPRLMVLAIPTEVMTRKDVRKVVRFFVKRRRVLVVFDESDDWGIPGSIRTKMARAVAKHCLFRIILSGTMLVATPLAAFSQFELLKPGALGFETFKEFKNHFAEYVDETRKDGRKYPRLVGYKSLDVLRKMMAPYTSVVLRDDVKDMPALNREPVEIEATEEQLRIYRELHSSIMVEIEEEDVSIGELAQRIGKLQQVFSGFLIDEFRDVHMIPGDNPRLDALVREVYLAPGKVIIWCQFQIDIDLVTARLRSEGYKIVEYHGRVSDRVKAESLNAFMTQKDVKGIVGQAQAGGRGRDMSIASTIIWYSHTFSARIREQAMERATKIGGGNIRVLDFIAPGPDAYMLKVTDGRVRMADSLTGRGMKAVLRGLAL